MTAALLPLCTAALLLGAALLFTVQPMMGRMVLPLVGGAPAVWTTCLLFFQAALLLGYLYAHWTSERLSPRVQATVHGVLMMVALAALPPFIDRSWGAPDPSFPVPWLLLRLFQSVGLPYVVVASTAPLVQRWFASSRHRAAADPYFLYAASNFGSLVGLLSYPVLIEPRLTLAQQSRAWTFGYGLLVAATLGVIVLTWSRRVDVPRSAVTAPPSPATITGVQRLGWVFLSFVPSTLMIAVTTHISTDVASVPLLWVMPLGVYLVTFMLAFSRRADRAVHERLSTSDPRPPRGDLVMAAALPIVLIPAVMTLLLKITSPLMVLPVHLLALFVAAFVCHRALFEARPTSAHVTGYYLWIAAGGVAGGLFAAVIAPVLFRTPLEYPLALALAAFCRPVGPESPARSPLDRWPIVVALFLTVGVGVTRGAGLPLDEPRTVALVFLPALLVCTMAAARPRAYAVGLTILLAFGTLWSRVAAPVDVVERNFFGVQTVRVSRDGRFRTFVHGSTIHGTQSLDPSMRREATTYFARSGPAGQLLSRPAPETRRFAVVGLGAGTLASYAQPGQQWTFYEINPAVERLARNASYFTYLSDCGASCQVVLGDARLTMGQAPDAAYDAIVLDAFNSDAIPAHLLTREALGQYMRVLAPGGFVLFHVSNRFLDLRPVIAGLAADAGLVAIGRTDVAIDPADSARGKTRSSWAVVARRLTDLGDVAEDPDWRPLRTDSRVGVWTDDFSNVFGLLIARRGVSFGSYEP